jgi:hypothetical protein
MPLQNRVNPFSKIIATPERGAYTGNRGVIHNNQKEIIKNHAVKYWITCLLKYKNMHRAVMMPNRWTELFFLDEATAFAAGHRPCGFCRHADFKRFKNLWLQANGAQYGFTANTKMDVIDAIIHAERLDANNQQKTFSAPLLSLPDAVFIKRPTKENAYLWYEQEIYQWSFKGYKKINGIDKNTIVDVLTPKSYVEVLKLGYKAQVHISVLNK